MGRRKRPFYRIVAIDSRTRRDGPEIERLGSFDPLKTDVAVDLKEDRIIHWLQQGALPSETVNNILSSVGLQYKIHLMHLNNIFEILYSFRKSFSYICFSCPFE